MVRRPPGYLAEVALSGCPDDAQSNAFSEPNPWLDDGPQDVAAPPGLTGPSAELDDAAEEPNPWLDGGPQDVAAPPGLTGPSAELEYDGAPTRVHRQCEACPMQRDGTSRYCRGCKVHFDSFRAWFSNTHARRQTQNLWSALGDHECLRIQCIQGYASALRKEGEWPTFEARMIAAAEAVHKKEAAEEEGS